MQRNLISPGWDTEKACFYESCMEESPSSKAGAERSGVADPGCDPSCLHPQGQRAVSHPWDVSAQLPLSSGHTWPRPWSAGRVMARSSLHLTSPMPSKWKWHFEPGEWGRGGGGIEGWQTPAVKGCQNTTDNSCAPQHLPLQPWVRFRANTAAFCMCWHAALNGVFDEQPSVRHGGVWPAGRTQGPEAWGLWERTAWMLGGRGYRRECFVFTHGKWHVEVFSKHLWVTNQIITVILQPVGGALAGMGYLFRTHKTWEVWGVGGSATCLQPLWWK